MTDLTPNPAYRERHYKDEYRPPVEERWIEGMRQEPAIIEVHTTWLYSEYDPRVLVPEGRTRHPFSRGGQVVASTLPEPSWSAHTVADYLHHAISAFGDDADLEIVVRRKGSERTVEQIRADLLEQLAALSKPTQHGRYAEVGYNDHFNDGLSAAEEIVEALA